MNLFDLKGKVAVVTGGNGGIGLGMAQGIASLGASIVIAGRNEAKAAEALKTLRDMGAEASFIVADVTHKAECVALIAAAAAKYGRVDILVNNAGILRDKAFNNMTMEDYEFVNQVHHFGTAYCIKAAWPIMRKQQYGRVVVTTSGSGTVGNFGQANYGAAKMAVNGLINVLRHEGAKYNIRLNAISPSAYTRMTESLLPPDIAPWMKPELVSPMVAWLCSEECDQNGEIMAATAGGYARVQYFVTEGAQFDPAEPVTIEMVRDSLDQIRDLTQIKPYFGMMGNVVEKLREMGRIK